MGTVAVPVSRLDAVMAKPLAEIVKTKTTFELLRFDVAVTAQAHQPGGYGQITFTLSSAPGVFEAFTAATKKAVKVLIMDEFGNRIAKTYNLSSKGETLTDTVKVPLADPSKLHGSTDRGRTIYVLADPFDEIYERTEANNFTSAYCYTIG